MEEKKYEYMLGVSDLGGFEILEPYIPSDQLLKEGFICIFYVDVHGMGDGDGQPPRIDLTGYKPIPDEVYQEAIRIFWETSDKMYNLSLNANKLDREIKEGDYLYRGRTYIYVDELSENNCTISFFDCSYSGLDTEEITESYLNMEDWFYDFQVDSLKEFKIINKEIYDKALTIAKSGVLEVKSYLKNILTGK